MAIANIIIWQLKCQNHKLHIIKQNNKGNRCLDSYHKKIVFYEAGITLRKKDIRKNDIENICKKVGIYDFVIDLPRGFDTIVGEKGVKLSGGQKQRIAIARALLSNSKIIIFDEATSALDSIAQKDILKNISDFLVDKTTIIIAHRLSTVKNADKIYVIDKGRVVDEGNHCNLVECRGMYSKLYNGEGGELEEDECSQ